MKKLNVLNEIKQFHAAVVEAVGEKRSNALLQAAFKVIQEGLKSAETGKVLIEGLGAFTIRVPKVVEGAEAKPGKKKKERRVTFRAVKKKRDKSKPKKKNKGEGEGEATDAAE